MIHARSGQSRGGACFVTPTLSPGFALQGLKRPRAGLAFERAPGSPSAARWRVEPPLMARASAANGEWAVHDCCCDCFVVLDEETQNSLASRSAGRRRCRLARRGRCACSVCRRPARDRSRTARRSQSCRGTTADVARWPGSPARATPMAEDACPGLPGRLSCALVSCVAYV